MNYYEAQVILNCASIGDADISEESILTALLWTRDIDDRNRQLLSQPQSNAPGQATSALRVDSFNGQSVCVEAGKRVSGVHEVHARPVQGLTRAFDSRNEAAQ